MSIAYAVTLQYRVQGNIVLAMKSEIHFNRNSAFQKVSVASPWVFWIAFQFTYDVLKIHPYSLRNFFISFDKYLFLEWHYFARSPLPVVKAVSWWNMYWMEEVRCKSLIRHQLPFLLRYLHKTPCLPQESLSEFTPFLSSCEEALWTVWFSACLSTIAKRTLLVTSFLKRK